MRQQLPDGDRLLDVLEALSSRELDAGWQSVAHAVIERLTEAQPAGRGLRLQASGDVDAVAVDASVVLLDDVAEMNADAHSHSSVFVRGACDGLDGFLYGQRRIERFGRGREH